ncbi:hypothetical protein [Streptomyces sp. E5N91]|nr:hypothetical protein [Streptomyces sp. E5N91]
MHDILSTAADILTVIGSILTITHEARCEAHKTNQEGEEPQG